jgi:hypothetical protein
MTDKEGCKNSAVLHKITLPISRESEREATKMLDGLRASVTIGYDKLVVAGIPASGASEARKKAEPVARKLLDLLCSMYDFCTEIGTGESSTRVIDSADTAEVESAGGDHTSMINSTSTISVTVRMVPHDAESNATGDTWRIGAIPYEHIPAMGSFRSAKLATNVFNSFRDFYLAAENAAHRLHRGPQKKYLLGIGGRNMYLDGV